MAVVKLVESASAPMRRPDGTYRVVLITPGQGSSAYYTEEMLRQYGAVAFPAGTHSYPKHRAPGESPNPLEMIGAFVSDAVYEEGVGLVSYLKPRESMVEALEEIAPYVGFSIYAQGEVTEQEVDGQIVRVAESLIPSVANTVDLVSYAGRGGHFAMAESLLEEAIENSLAEASAEDTKEGNEHMPTLEEKVTDLISVVESLVAEVVTAREELVAAKAEVAESVADASKAVDAADAVNKADVPESFKESLRNGIKAGNYDVEARISEVSALLEEDRKAHRVEAPQYNSLSESLGTVSLTESADDLIKGWA